MTRQTVVHPRDRRGKKPHLADAAAGHRTERRPGARRAGAFGLLADRTRDGAGQCPTRPGEDDDRGERREQRDITPLPGAPAWRRGDDAPRRAVIPRDHEVADERAVVGDRRLCRPGEHVLRRNEIATMALVAISMVPITCVKIEAAIEPTRERRYITTTRHRR